MGTVEPYQLRGLPEDKSLALFKRLAFKKGQEESDPNMMVIGEEIVKKCANVPLAIRTIAALLYSKNTEQEWENFRNTELRMINSNENNIMSSLKLSYNHLPSHLKRCFAYCSLFPKDYTFDKHDLIYLWMAQGFIRPLDGSSSQSLEDVGHGYFMELFRRSFFQEAPNVLRDDIGDVTSCTMHDLMHDLAQDVAGNECVLVNRPPTEDVNNGTIWHISFPAGASWAAASSLLSHNRLRSLLQPKQSCGLTTLLNVKDIFSYLRFLRALDLGHKTSQTLPSSIGELKHLRYLKVGSFRRSRFPECITKLQYLQTLDLRGNAGPTYYPRGFNKLTNLRHLLTKHSGSLICQPVITPPGVGELTNLQALDVFAVGRNMRLDALALTGNMEIHFDEHHRASASEAKAANLERKKLTGLEFRWFPSYREPVTDSDMEEDDLVLKCLQPSNTLKKLCVYGWKGRSFPSWGIDESPCQLPNLVHIDIAGCDRCQNLPPFSRLPYLRVLCLRKLGALEYIETTSSAAVYFPSLKRLALQELTNLKGWSSTVKDCIDQQIHEENHQTQPTLPHVSNITVVKCPKLMSFPRAPSLVSLNMHRVCNKTVLEDLLYTGKSCSSSTVSILRSLSISYVDGLDGFSINQVFLENLTICSCDKLTKLSAESPNSLARLSIERCGRLKDIGGALQHLSALEELSIENCEELDVWGGAYDETNVSSSSETFEIAAWKGLESLRSLHLSNIRKLESLPKGIGCLTTLQELIIQELPNLRTLPKWIGKLTQLDRLRIARCPELKERCQGPDGEDWPLIQHIPNLFLQ